MNSIQLLLDSSSLINYYNLLPSHRHVFPVSAAVGWLKQPMSLRQYIAKGNSRELLSSVMNLDVTAVTGNAALRPLLKISDCKKYNMYLLGLLYPEAWNITRGMLHVLVFRYC